MLANFRIDFKKFIATQLVIFAVGISITSYISGLSQVFAYTLGSATMFLANFIFFARLFINKQFSPLVEIMIFYMSEFLKLAIVATIAVVVAIFVKPKLFPYIFGLISLQLVVCFIPMLFKRVK